MAVFTQLSDQQAQHIADACSLGPVTRVVPVPEGSVNSNYFIDTADQTVFVRVYEEQGLDGVRYEWALLRYLQERGFAVAGPWRGLSPDRLQFAGKPVGVFECVGGQQSCQRAVTVARAAAVGQWLATVHGALQGFPEKRLGRFTLEQISQRLSGIDVGQDESLARALLQLESLAMQLSEQWPPAVPCGVIHGDLFRDNVRWSNNDIVAVIDWESASEGPFVYDLMVAVLAWCFDDDWNWELASAMVRAYDQVRCLNETERLNLRLSGVYAALRFTVTRITDFHLRQSIGQRVQKDYRRFLRRLELISAYDNEEFQALCYGSGVKNS